MEKRKPKIGEILFLVDVGNLARDGWGRQRDCTVSKVGRKYFYVIYGDQRQRVVKISLETWQEHSDYSADHVLYESRQEWEDACLTTKYYRAIREAFTCRFGDNVVHKALPRLKQIAEILNITLP